MHFAQLTRREHDDGFVEHALDSQQGIEVRFPLRVVAFLSTQNVFHAGAMVAVLRVPALLVIVIGRCRAVGIVEGDVAYVFGIVGVGIGPEVESQFAFSQEKLACNGLYECAFPASVQSDDGYVFPLLQLKVYGGCKAAVYVTCHSVAQRYDFAHVCRSSFFGCKSSCYGRKMFLSVRLCLEKV